MRIVWLLILALTALLGTFLYTHFERDAPVIHTATHTMHIGGKYSHEFRLMDVGMGIETVRVWLQSGETQIELLNRSYDGDLFRGAAINMPRAVDVSFDARELKLAPGPATLHAEVVDFAWAPNKTAVSVPLMIDTRAPRISLQTGLTYVRRGGSEAVVYQLNEEVEEHGVAVGDELFPGFKHPNDPTRFIAFYALSPDASSVDMPAIVASDRAGNRTRMPISISVIEREFPSDEINLSDSFLDRKIAEILGGEHPDRVGAYLQINDAMRAQNAATIREICANSSRERLWSGSFLQLPNSRVGAVFAEHRTYKYGGAVIDTQTHLGYDLASTSRAEIPAANDGVVIFADELGIYGQTVIIDHGLSLFSLYGHLSEISSEKGQAVARGEVIGTTGATGLAGGDHLHFAMLIHGSFVDPLEWFDGRWIREHIDPKFADAPQP